MATSSGVTTAVEVLQQCPGYPSCSPAPAEVEFHCQQGGSVGSDAPVSGHEEKPIQNGTANVHVVDNCEGSVEPMQRHLCDNANDNGLQAHVPSNEAAGSPYAGESNGTAKPKAKSAVAERMRALRRASATGVDASHLQVKRQTRRTATTGKLICPSGGPARPRRVLKNISELRVVKLGLQRLHDELVANPCADAISEVPRRADGSEIVLRSWLRRLLSDQVELKGSLETDVAASQSDLRYLNLEQLLVIRLNTLDLLTESTSHNAHNSFLNTADAHLYEKLARRLLRRVVQEGEIEVPLPNRPEPLRILGLRAVLIFGAAQAIADGWSAPSTVAAAEGSDLPPVPPLWVVRLDESWQPCKAALCDTKTLSLQVLPSECPDFIGATAGGHVALFTDRTTGQMKDRLLHWEIAVLDPSVDDVNAELNRAAPKKSLVSNELVAVLAQRKGTGLEDLTKEEETSKSSERQEQTPAPAPRRQSFGRVAELIKERNQAAAAAASPPGSTGGSCTSSPPRSPLKIGSRFASTAAAAVSQTKDAAADAAVPTPPRSWGSEEAEDVLLRPLACNAECAPLLATASPAEATC